MLLVIGPVGHSYFLNQFANSPGNQAAAPGASVNLRGVAELVGKLVAGSSVPRIDTHGQRVLPAQQPGGEARKASCRFEGIYRRAVATPR